MPSGRDQSFETHGLEKWLPTLLPIIKGESSVETEPCSTFRLVCPKGEVDRAGGRVFDLPTRQL